MSKIIFIKHSIKSFLNVCIINFKVLVRKKSDESFAEFQKKYYDLESNNMLIEDHVSHNYNPNLWLIGYGPLLLYPQKFRDSNCLDFACGTGRNMINLDKFNIFKEVHGADISSNNLNNARIKHASNFNKSNFKYHLTDGKSAKIGTDKKFHFIFSTIAFQHIPVYRIRISILEDLISVLHEDGVLSFQMGFGSKKFGGRVRSGSVSYKTNFTSARATNGSHDARVESPNEIVKDLNNLGLPYVKIFITEAFNDKHPFWIWVWGAKKPFILKDLDQLPTKVF